MGYNLLINGIYWGYTPLIHHLLTSWDIQVGLESMGKFYVVTSQHWWETPPSWWVRTHLFCGHHAKCGLLKSSQSNNPDTAPVLAWGIMWVLPKIMVPQNGWFIREIPIKKDDLGGFTPLFLVQHPCGHHQLNSRVWFANYLVNISLLIVFAANPSNYLLVGGFNPFEKY